MNSNPTASLLRSLFYLLPMAAALASPASAFADTRGPAAATAPDDGSFTPKEYPLSRYEPLKKKSPFEFEPPKEAVADAEDPFLGVSLAGYCGSGNSMTVYLIAGKEKKRITVFGDGSPYKKRDTSDFRVVGINRGKTLKTTSVTLEGKNREKKEVKFEEDTLKNAKGGAAVGAQPGGQMNPGQPGQPGQRNPQVIRPGGNQVPPPYVAPQAFIPGQSNPPQQQPQQGNPAFLNGNVPPNQATMSNQQLINQLTTNAQQQVPGNPNGVQVQGGDQSRAPVPPQAPRRRVVLPTQ